MHHQLNSTYYLEAKTSIDRIFLQLLAKALEFWVYLPIDLNAGKARPVFEWFKSYDKFILMGAAKPLNGDRVYTG